MKLLILLTALLSLCLPPAARAVDAQAPDVRQAGTPNQIEPGIFDVPVIVSDPQDGRREEFRRTFHNAQRSLRKFAQQNGWTSLMDKPFVQQVEIYDSKPAFDERIRQLSPGDQSPIPKTYSAGVENGILFLVAPELYAANFPDGRGPLSYEKLMVHELAHRLHLRACGDKDELMGPIWFWEGLGTYAADQFPGNKALPDTQVWEIVAATDRGSYRKYNAVFTQLLKQKGVTLPEFVKQAGQPDFTAWLKQPSGNSR